MDTKNKKWIKVLIIFLIVVIVGSYIMIKYSTPQIVEEETLSFQGIDDPNLQEYVIDELYSNLGSEFDSDDYEISQISTVYISKEYLEELAYNTKSNIYFGFTLEELENYFEGSKYVFTVGDNNETTVKEFEFNNDNYEKMIKNVAIGSGVILACVTISVLSSGTMMAVIFAASAKTATTFALSSATMSGVLAGGIEYYQSGDVGKAIEKGSLEATEGFKWGAIIGAVSGGASETFKQFKTAKQLKTMDYRERGAMSEARALQKYGGREQVSYINGEEVSQNIKTATRPDIVREIDGHLEGIEVKNYNLNSKNARKDLVKELKRQVTERTINMPEGSTQRIVLDTRGRNYDKNLLKNVIEGIRNACSDVYPNIPIDVMV